LALNYRQGKGVERDLQQAKRLLEESRDQGNQQAEAILQEITLGENGEAQNVATLVAVDARDQVSE
jgi:TPR repeat protein